jgi:hypothetical protein
MTKASLIVDFKLSKQNLVFSFKKLIVKTLAYFLIEFL